MTSQSTLSYGKIILAYAGWWVLWMLAQTLLLSGSLESGVAFQDAFVTQMLTAVAGYAINTSMHAYQPSRRNSVYILIQTIFIAAVSVALLRIILRGWIPAPQYVIWLEGTLFLRFGYIWLMLLLIAVLTWFWVFVADSIESARRKEVAAQLARDAELANLRRQLQPHFLFNSLNSISALVGNEPEQARTMVQQLSDFLRGTLRQDDHSLISLEEELRLLDLYLSIEKIRFGHRLQTVMDVEAEARQAQLPALLLQPILENAIKFGLYDTTGDTTIRLSARLNRDQLVVTITNPFDSATVVTRPGTGFGLSSVQRRLFLLYHRSDLLTTRSGEQEFITTVLIPR